MNTPPEIKTQKYTPFSYHLPASFGYSIVKLPQDVLDEIEVGVNKIKSSKPEDLKPYNHYLVGQIDREYEFELGPKTQKFINLECNEFSNKHCAITYNIAEHFRAIKGKELILDPQNMAWINFQSKYEYNPLHHHSGALSFVIWYDIPYTKEKETEIGPGRKKQKGIQPNHNGDFYFAVPGPNGVESISLEADKTWNGHMVIFPASTQHGVYPFYSSDDYRISISGNLFVAPIGDYSTNDNVGN